MSRQLGVRGFTLVEMMVVVAIVGVLAALGMNGVSKYIAAAKAVEARRALGKIGKDASSAYDRGILSGDIVGLGESTEATARICPTAAWPIPGETESIRGRKYQSSPKEWNDEAGWSCLKFMMKDPQYFQYYFAATPDSGGWQDGDQFDAVARGDLNGDGVLSRFDLFGRIQQDEEGGAVLTVAPGIRETNPEE
jgi:prepilin-type N-terminal cleavage/methylation domain-containing protein